MQNDMCRTIQLPAFMDLPRLSSEACDIQITQTGQAPIKDAQRQLARIRQQVPEAWPPVPQPSEDSATLRHDSRPCLAVYSMMISQEKMIVSIHWNACSAASSVEEAARSFNVRPCCRGLEERTNVQPFSPALYIVMFAHTHTSAEPAQAMGVVEATLMEVLQDEAPCMVDK